MYLQEPGDLELGEGRVRLVPCRISPVTTPGVILGCEGSTVREEPKARHNERVGWMLTTMKVYMHTIKRKVYEFPGLALPGSPLD